MLVNRNLTPKQKAILDFIASHIAKRGYAPSFKEIGDAFGLKSNGSVAQYIDALEEKGYLSRGDGNRQLFLSQDNIGEELAEIFLLGTIAAGSPIEPVESPEPISVPKSMLPHAGRCYALRVQGDSMIDEHICDGDIILVKHQREPNVGDIVVAITEKGATLKRFCRDHNNDAFLQPRNSKLKPFYPKTLEIRGKYLGLIRHGEESAL